MKVWLIRLLVIAVYAVALFLPGYIFFHQRGGLSFLAHLPADSFLQLAFPLVGLYAFALVSLQVLLAANKRWLAVGWPNVIKFHAFQGGFAFLFALLHPLFILLGFGVSKFLHYQFVSSNLIPYAVLAEATLVFLASTVAVAVLAWHGRNLPWWLKWHRLNYLVFAALWVHSWFIGSDVRTTSLRYLWIGFAVAVAISAVARHRPGRAG